MAKADLCGGILAKAGLGRAVFGITDRGDVVRKKCVGCSGMNGRGSGGILFETGALCDNGMEPNGCTAVGSEIVDCSGVEPRTIDRGDAVLEGYIRCLRAGRDDSSKLVGGIVLRKFCCCVGTA